MTTVSDRLTPRIMLGALVLVVVSVASFGSLWRAIADEHDASVVARRARADLNDAQQLERLVFTADVAARTAAVSGDTNSTADLLAAAERFDVGADKLTARSDTMAAPDVLAEAVQVSRAHLSDVLPLLVGAGAASSSARPSADVQATTASLERVADRFADYRDAELASIEAQQAASDGATERGVLLAALGLGVSLAIVAAFVTYLELAVLRPLRRAASMADVLADGDLSARMEERGSGEVGQLERSFNSMASSLEQARDELSAFAQEQRSLHRVAELVARGVETSELFDAVVAEVATVLGSDVTILLRFEPTRDVRVLAVHGDAPWLQVDSCWALGTTDPATAFGDVDDEHPPHVLTTADSELSTQLMAHGLAGAAIAPIIVQGVPWGAVSARWHEPVSDQGVQAQALAFTELVATAIANAHAGEELRASRARIVAAGDQARRRIERDLHDGAQQQLVTLALQLRLAQALVPDDADELAHELLALAGRIDQTVVGLQELSRGIHPAILTQGGLVPALRTLARRAAVATSVHADEIGRLPEPIEVAAYYLVSEALTNAIKHARADAVAISVTRSEGRLQVALADDGEGGATFGAGSGLIGLRDRIEAIGGQLTLTSSIGNGTSILAVLPTTTPRDVEPPPSSST